MKQPHTVLVLLALVAAAACSSSSDPPSASAEKGAVEAVAASAPGPEEARRSPMPPRLRAAYITSVQQGAGSEYRFEASSLGDRVVAHNAAQGLRAELADGALRVRPDSEEPDWTFELRWTGLGRGDRLEAVERPLGPGDVATNRVSYRRPGGSEEWFLNGPLGIEHGFVLAEPPPASPGPRTDEALSLELSVTGGLVPTSGSDGSATAGSESGAAVALRTASGRVVLHYSELYVNDADGRPLGARFEVVDQRILLRIDDRAARYPLRIDPLVWFERGELVPVDAEVADCFGISSVIDGDTAIVGAPGALAGGGDVFGSAYVFARTGDVWTQQDELLPSDGTAGDRFGVSVALHGITALVGAFDHEHGDNSGSAYVFVRSANDWLQQEKLTASDGAHGDYLGVSVALEGDTALVGGYRCDAPDDDSGAAYVFVRSADSWTPQDKLLPSDSGLDREFGFTVSLSGETALVGAPGDLGNFSWAGAAYVFVRSAGAWLEEGRLVADDGAPGDFFGGALSLEGDTALVGAPGKFAIGTVPGAAYVFTRSGVAWTQHQKLTPIGSAVGDRFAASATLSGDMALLGAAEGTGAIYLFRDYGAVWTEEQKITGDYGGLLGVAMSVSGDTMVGTAVDFMDCGWSGAFVFALEPANGTPCDDGSDCGSGYCVDEVCCDSECGGGVAGDCWVCSVAAGGSRDGICESLAGNSCDDGAYCNGTDACSETGCDSSSGDPCAPNLGDDDMDCSESCNEEADDCSADDPDRALCAYGGECLAGSCRLPGGAPCTTDPECASEYCVHEVCCTEPDCAPYRCGPTGACLTSCTSTNDCVPGFTCNWERLCVESWTEEEAGGCGCRLPATTTAPPAWAALGLLGLGLVGIGRRRRVATATMVRRVRG